MYRRNRGYGGEPWVDDELGCAGAVLQRKLAVRAYGVVAAGNRWIEREGAAGVRGAAGDGEQGGGQGEHCCGCRVAGVSRVAFV